MDIAYIGMCATFGAAFMLSVATRSKWVSVGLPLLIPVVGTVSSMIGKGPVHWDAILFASPFLLAIVVLYSVISFLGSRAGGWFRRTFLNSSASKDRE
jgi:hypothetical protein